MAAALQLLRSHTDWLLLVRKRVAGQLQPLMVVRLRAAGLLLLRLLLLLGKVPLCDAARPAPRTQKVRPSRRLAAAALPVAAPH